MAASDQHYRSQRALDIVFAVSAILTTLSIVWMFADDYFREWKSVQRKFRDVEEKSFQVAMLQSFPPEETLKAFNDAEQKLFDARKEVAQVEADNSARVRNARAKKAMLEARFQGVKANYDSLISLYNEYVDNRDRAAADSAEWKRNDAEARTRLEAARKLDQEMTDLRKQIKDADTEIAEAEQNTRDREKEKARELSQVLLANNLMDYSVGELDTLDAVQDQLKKKTSEFDRLAKTAAAKRWKFGDTFRNLPVIDGFAAPTRIQQITLDDLTIDYSFKRVTRYDRCTTCHLGIDRPALERERLVGLDKVPEDLGKRLDAAINLLKEREKRGEKLGFDPDDIRGNFKELNLTPAQVTEYCAHPRLDLFVDGNSPHSAEKFGCTICHGGQGSATDFKYAVHTPDNALQMANWKKSASKDNPHGHEWEASHFWDFPMLPNRFVESSCLKCHHQVTDLVRYGSKVEAPKLFRGYNLVRENGCFGCHEIAGMKGGRPVGPDLRLEPNVLPLEALTPAERTTALSDPLNPPGTMRKVGPSLYRVAEKTNEDWARKWIHAPRGFRPDTKMPHFYGLSTNNHDYLAREDKEIGRENNPQTALPDAEMYAIAYYLFRESKGYLGGEDSYFKQNLDRRLLLLARQRAEAELRKKIAAAEGDEKKTLETQAARAALTDRDVKELNEVGNRLETALRYNQLAAVEDRRLTPEQALAQAKEGLAMLDALPPEPAALKKLNQWVETGKDGIELLPLEPVKLKEAYAKLRGMGLLPVPFEERLTDEQGKVVTLPKVPAGKERDTHLALGNRLFREKGCLACHTHEATAKADTDETGKHPLPAVTSEADFGPNLSRLAAKLKNARGEATRPWLVQWIMNPKVYHPRTRMPVTHLNVTDAAAVADWLLAQPTDWKGEDVARPSTDTLKELVRLPLQKMLTKQDVDDGFLKSSFDEHFKHLKWDADERALLGGLTDDKMLWYAGKRAISRLGCFGCHSVPGFESAKPIGTPLNDWGKKDPERLAFESITGYVKEETEKKKVVLVDKMSMQDEEFKKLQPDQEAYEKYFAECLNHHGDAAGRMGFLHQKLMEPRAFDYHRQVGWEDRLRMPQFRFARGPAVKPAEGEDRHQAEARAEAEARDAVMTFVLGLVAEPIPLKYVNQPVGDRLAEVKGRQVLDKFNCAGCHQVRSGVYEFRRDKVQDILQGIINDRGYQNDMAKDHFFADHNAWVGRPQPVADRILAHANTQRLFADPDTNESIRSLRLNQALRFLPDPRPFQDIPAGRTVNLPESALLPGAADPYGGTFANLMVDYVSKRGYGIWDDPTQNRQRAGLPPPLLREGERTQPDWLFRFLRDPGEVRPQFTALDNGQRSEGILILRMPRFNFSDDDIHALVAYFAAADRLDNPAFGLTYPYPTLREKENGYLAHMSRQYGARLSKEQLTKQAKQLYPIWTEEDVAKAEAAVRQAKEIAAVAPKDKQDEAKKALAQAEKDLAALKEKTAKGPLPEKALEAYFQNWKSERVYATDTWRMMTNIDLRPCAQCHNIANIPAKELQGPPLALSAERLRPGWLERWIANPERMTTYAPMPANFPKEVAGQANQKEEEKNPFKGNSRQQITAVRDVLINFPKVANWPENRYYRPPAEEPKKP